MPALIGALLGAAMGCGLFAAAAGLQTSTARQTARRSIRGRWRRQSHRAVLICSANGVIGFAAATATTGWPAAGFIGAALGLGLPTIIGANSKRVLEINRMTALATWVEMVRDTISVAPGLTEALKATAATAPAPLRIPVRQLAARAERTPLPDALARFADEMDHPVADTVAITLGLAATNQVGTLQESLSEIAASTRQEVSMRLRIQASRARQFTSARFTAGVVAVFSIAMVTFNRSYLAPFGTSSGQIALTVIGGLFIGSGIALAKMGRFETPPRILNAHRNPDPAGKAIGLSAPSASDAPPKLSDPAGKAIGLSG